MAVTWTSRGIARFTAWLDGDSVPSALRLRLTTDVPTWATKRLNELDEIPNGNGYSAINVNPSSTNWPNETENDADGALYLDRSSRELKWDATGDIPSSGDGFMAVVLTESGSNPNVIAYIDLRRARSILSGTSLTIPSLALRFAAGELADSEVAWHLHRNQRICDRTLRVRTLITTFWTTRRAADSCTTSE